jgi:putative membrane protein
MIDFIFTFFKGVLIGIANIIPGVSGGTMAFILGIYKELTEAVGFYFQNSAKRKQYTILLLKIGLGAIVGVVLFARLFTFLLEDTTSAQYTYLFFIGLIIGAVPFILNLHHDMKVNPKRLIIFVVAIAAVIITSYFGQKSGGEGNMTPEIIYQAGDLITITTIDFFYALWLIFCGFIGALSMVLPGFSGSALLVSLGEYYNILHFVDNRMIVQILLVGLGVLPGLIVASKVINKLMEKYPPETYYFILGLIAASVIQVSLEVMKEPVLGLMPIIFSFVFLLLGFAASYLMSGVKK